jgi:hypothetical protein
VIKNYASFFFHIYDKFSLLFLYNLYDRTIKSMLPSMGWQKPGLFGHLELLIKKCVAYPQEDFLFTILYGAFLVP